MFFMGRHKNSVINRFRQPTYAHKDIQMIGAERALLVGQIEQRYWNLRSFWMPEELAKIPTMLTKEETRMLAWIAGNWVKGYGAVIDLGSFLGGSTAHLVYGVSRSFGCDNVTVEAFDQFTIGDRWKKPFLYDWGYPELKGNDMLHLFEEFVSPFGKVRPHRCQIEEAKWSGDPIEILFVDICKSWSATYQVMRQFYPCLIPNESIVIQQDFQHFQQPWVVATTQYLNQYLRFISYTEENSAIFLCTKKIPPDVIERAIEETKDVSECIKLIERAHDLFPYARQREAVWQHIKALQNNWLAKNSWELSLTPTKDN
jgi:hypothetical protein